MTENNNNSRRRRPRFKVKFNVVFDDKDSYNVGTVINVSESGLFIATVAPLKPGEEITITAVEGVGVFEARGRVMRKVEYPLDEYFKTTPGMGVQLLDVTDEDMKALNNAMKRSTDDDED